MRLDVVMLGNLPRKHAAQEQLDLLEKSIYTRAIDISFAFAAHVFFYHLPIGVADR